MRTAGLILLLAALLTAVRGVLATLAAPQLPATGFFGWLALADLVIAGLLVTVARHAAWRGTRLGIAIFTIAFGIGSIGTLVEAVLFGLFPPAAVVRLALSALLVALVAAVGVVALAGAPVVPPSRGRRPLGWHLARIAGGSLLYTTCYLAAGIAVLPFVRGFYEHGGGLPSGGTTFAMQLFFRGPLLVLIAGLLVRMTTLPRQGHAALVAATLVGLGGVAPLLVPNAFLPDAVRWAHLAEITVSNALFGWVMGWVYAAPGTDGTITDRPRTAPETPRSTPGTVM